MAWGVALVGAVVGSVAGGCAGPIAGRPGELVTRRTGEEMVFEGKLYHVGAPVVLFNDPGGYNAYSTVKRWGRPSGTAGAGGGPADGSPRYGVRFEKSPAAVRATPLRERIDQFVIHYDVCGTSRQCFRILHDVRGLSVHFMLDVDGTIYQTLDLKERAWHAAEANDRSVGVEIANIGAYAGAPGKHGLPAPLGDWYAPEGTGWRLALPHWMGDGGLPAGFVGRPRRAQPVEGAIHGKNYVMMDLTEAQYESLVKLTAALARVFPRVELDCPRDSTGKVRTDALSAQELVHFRGLVGHHHLTRGKIDPGPAFDWEYVLGGARRAARGETQGKQR